MDAEQCSWRPKACKYMDVCYFLVTGRLKDTGSCKLADFFCKFLVVEIFKPVWIGTVGRAWSLEDSLVQILTVDDVCLVQ
eukprot:6190211-Pleurochrysis_carterae.AAC.4